jgi:hypothetical protein
MNPKMLRWERYVAHMEEMRNAYTTLFVEPKRKKNF